MHTSTLFGLMASIAAANAVSQGFNYGSTQSDGTPVTQSTFQSMFQRAQNLPGTSGFNSARLYTMIQGGTTNSPIEAIPAAIATKTQLLLGMWCSAGSADFDNEVAALSAAIKQYGSDFTNLVTAISVGSEDLYRDSVTGIANNDGVGVGPSVIVGYIQQVKSALQGTALSSVSIGHVDTWDAWTNSSNAAVIENVDWLGVDSYPYFETTVTNPISDGKSVFYTSIDNVKGVAGNKEVWVTETGWPVSGPTSGEAVASVQNAETYWQDVGCSLFGNVNTWWYTITDSLPTTPSPSFGLIGSDLQSAPLYNLTCSAQPTSTGNNNNGTSKGSHTSTATSQSTGSSSYGGSSSMVTVATSTSIMATSMMATPTGSSSTSTPTGSTNGAGRMSASIGAGIMAAFGLAALL